MNNTSNTTFTDMKGKKLIYNAINVLVVWSNGFSDLTTEECGRVSHVFKEKKNTRNHRHIILLLQLS